MTATLVEHAQFLDSSGAPISGGKQYFGTNGADPVATAGVTTIFSDRALTTAIPNPQTLGTDGRTLNKVWVSGKYSTQVNSLVGVVETQEFQDLDAGTASGALSSLFVTGIVGGDTITGSTDEALSSYADNQQYVFLTASANSGPVTVNWDGVGAKAVVKNNDQPLVDGDWAANQVVILARNGTNDNFEWVNHNNKVVQFSEGASVASAATTDIWATDGNTLHITGTTGITSFGTAPNVGARRKLVFDSTPIITHGASAIVLPGGVNFTAAAGDIFEVYADTLTQHLVEITKADGTAVVVTTVAFTKTFISTGQTITSAGLLTLAHSLSAKPLLVVGYIKNTSAEFNYSVGDELEITVAYQSSATVAERGLSVVPDGTNLNIRMGSATSVFTILNKTTGAAEAATNANWDLFLKAWV